jgi:urate oxidase
LWAHGACVFQSGIRIVSCVVVLSRYSGPVSNYDATYEAVKAAIGEAFFGPPKTGIYSPSVQYTVYEMGKNVLAK